MDGALKSCWICDLPLDAAEGWLSGTDGHGIKDDGSQEGNGHSKFKAYLKQLKSDEAETIKYDPSLCQNCNSTFVRPFDKAYENFISWVFENEEAVIRRRMINLSHVYTENYVESQRNLYKYFAKNFGCRLVNENIQVPVDVKELMRQENFRTALRMTFAVDEDLLSQPQRDRTLSVRPGVYVLPHGDERWTFIWHQAVDWLTIFFWYNCAIELELGFPWVADSQYLHLGTYSLSTPGWHSEFIHELCKHDRASLDAVGEERENRQEKGTDP